ncbi:MAG: FAD-dependent oxidoreductase [Patescibacteria group bacterium]
MTAFVIIGGGIAGVTAAEELRKLDAEASISIIEREDEPLYSKVLLPKYATSEINREKLFLKKPEWYAKHHIEWFSGVEAIKIDAINKFVETSEGREIPFDKLLITTGLDVNLLGDDKKGVAYLRTLGDTDHLKELIAEAKATGKNTVAVMGGSFIAMELINIFRHFGFDTTVLLRGGFWSKSLSPESQAILRTHIESQGMKIIESKEIPELTGDMHLEGLKIEGKEIPATILGVGIGLHPDLELFKSAGIECGAGILANEYLETNQQDIFVAGDVAEFMDLSVGRRRVSANWMNAIMQGRVVAQNMMGNRVAFELVTSYSAWLAGLSVVFIGDTSREHATEVRQTVLENEKAEELFLRNGILVGAALVGDISRRQELTDMIKNKTSIL